MSEISSTGRVNRVVAFFAHHASDFAHDALDELADGHSRWDSVWIYDDIWSDALRGKRHVLLRVRHTDSTFWRDERKTYRQLVEYAPTER